MIKAEIILDSIAPSGKRLTTFVLTYPRFIHSEFMTHRAFSRNASSSRAIPVNKQIEMIEKNPVVPIAFTKNQKGMQGGEALVGEEAEQAEFYWLEAMKQAVHQARKLSSMGVHKQYANRILEPWAHITVVCTATDFANFFALRIHPAAQPEIQALASAMYDEYENSNPQKLEVGDWHLPFIVEGDFSENSEMFAKINGMTMDELNLKRSVARCARVSYLNHDGSNVTIQQDLELYDRLVGATPIHASPAEHQAVAASDPDLRSGNFNGWVQYRQTLKDQKITEFKREN